jgi:hypothetical protein
MSRGALTVPREAQSQPTASSTKRGQKRYIARSEFDPTQLNIELDYIHERLNQIVLESPALADLAGSATLANVITRLNAITEILRDAGLIRPE